MLEAERLLQIRNTIGAGEWSRAGIEDLARAAGLSRMTLHRRGVTKEAIADGLAELLVSEYETAGLPALVSSAAADVRLGLALNAFCDVNERFLGVIDGLGERVGDVFHEDSGAEVGTRPLFTEALRRILEDGVRDGTLDVSDVSEAVTLLFNATTWTYHHMRVGHRWSREKARDRVVELLVRGLAK